jgi:hypothetical protein
MGFLLLILEWELMPDGLFIMTLEVRNIYRVNLWRFGSGARLADLGEVA